MIAFCARRGFPEEVRLWSIFSGAVDRQKRRTPLIDCETVHESETYQLRDHLNDNVGSHVQHCRRRNDNRPASICAVSSEYLRA